MSLNPKDTLSWIDFKIGKKHTQCLHVFVKILAGNHLPCSHKFIYHLYTLIFRRTLQDNKPHTPARRRLRFTVRFFSLIRLLQHAHVWDVQSTRETSPDGVLHSLARRMRGKFMSGFKEFKSQNGKLYTN